MTYIKNAYRHYEIFEQDGKYGLHGRWDPTPCSKFVYNSCKEACDASLWQYKIERKLFSAAARRKFGAVKSLLKEGAEINSGHPVHGGPIHAAAMTGVMDGEAFMAESYSAESGLPMMQMLHSLGGSFAVTDCNCQTALHTAVQFGNAIAVEYLLQFIDPNSASTFETPIFIAAKHGYHNISRMLLDAGADACIYFNGDTPLCSAARGANKTWELKDKEQFDKFQHNRFLVAQQLIDSGASPHVQSVDGQMPLHHAVESGNVEIVELLIDAGADVNVTTKNRYNSSALNIANRMLDMLDTGHRRQEIKGILLQNGAVA